MICIGSGLILDHTNGTDVAEDVTYASISAPGVVLCEVKIDGELWDAVFVGNGGTHSWWTSAHAKFLPPQGLLSGQRVTVEVSGLAALRVDWT